MPDSQNFGGLTLPLKFCITRQWEQNFRMRNIIATICLMTAVLVGSTGCQTVSLISAKGLTGGSLPPCVGKPSLNSPWHNCYGTNIFSDGRKYVGEYMGNQYHGQGTVTYVAPHEHEGFKYVGEFAFGVPHGEGTGTVVAPHEQAGFKYVGGIFHGKSHGDGTLTFIAPNERAGFKYVGEFENDKPHGEGTATFVAPHKLAGLKYVGVFEKGTWSLGEGTATFVAPHKRAGQKYVGEFENERPHGQGTVTYVAPHKLAGLKYVGRWREDQYHGQGTMTFVAPHKLEGLEFIGEWRDNKLISRVVVKPPLNRCYVFKARSSKRIKGCKDAVLNTDEFEGNSTNGIESRLTKLKSLHRKGLISDSEYKAKQRDVLQGL
jgi:hypothetical protein